MRVDEAARLLRISRSAAYEAANAWLRTGEEGLPCIRIGRRILVARAAIEDWANTGTTNRGEATPPSFT
jgi:excisionase family DNA binding protein